MRKRARFILSVVGLAILSVFVCLSGYSQSDPQNTGKDMQKQEQSKSKVVYVCACLKTKSCSCMTEAKTKGPCACGTQGGPPMKAVPPDSDWAKQNREALAN
jgi:hypothetical protein